MRTLKFLAITFVSLWLSSPLAGASESMLAYRELENSAYRFTDKLPTDGRSELIKPELYRKQGIWAEDRFIFPCAGKDADLIFKTSKIDDKSIETIELQLKPGLTRYLKFTDIASAAKLVVYFRVLPPAENEKTLASTYVSISIGKRLLDRVRLTPDMLWVRKEYPFKSARFLKQKLSVSLNMAAGDDNALLTIFGYTKR